MNANKRKDKEAGRIIMDDQFREFTDVPTPTLSFGAPVEEKPEPVAVKEEPVQPQLDESMLSDEERRMVDEFSKQIDIHNTNGILQYGVGTQKKMADFCMMKSLRFHPLVRRKPKSTDPNGKIFRLLRLITCYLLFGAAIIILPVMLVCIKMMHSGSYLKSFSLKLKTNVLVLSTFM